MNTVKIKSERLGKEYDVELFEKDGTLIIRHTALENMYWNLPDEKRPSFSIEPFDVSKMPGIPPLFAVKCILKKENIVIEQIGEMTCESWVNSNPVTKDFPLTTCKNRAFDRAFIRYMQFNISAFNARVLYSTEEIPLTPEMNNISLMDKNLGPAHPASAENASGHNSLPTSDPNIPDINFPYSGMDTTPATDDFSGYPNDNFSDEIPWPGMDEFIPDGMPMPPMPEYDQNPNALNIRNVAFDSQRRRVCIDTSDGIIYFDPDNNNWFSSTVNVNTIDLQGLYQDASNYIPQDLSSYRG